MILSICVSVKFIRIWSGCLASRFLGDSDCAREDVATRANWPVRGVKDALDGSENRAVRLRGLCEGIEVLAWMERVVRERETEWVVAVHVEKDEILLLNWKVWRWSRDFLKVKEWAVVKRT